MSKTLKSNPEYIKLEKAAKDCFATCSDYSCVRGDGCTGHAGHAFGKFMSDWEDYREILLNTEQEKAKVKRKEYLLRKFGDS